MRTKGLMWEQLVLAFDRVAMCLRLVPGASCDFLDEFGQIVSEYTLIDTEAGIREWVDAEGMPRKERGNFYIAVKKEFAKQLQAIGHTGIR